MQDGFKKIGLWLASENEKNEILLDLKRIVRRHGGNKTLCTVGEVEVALSLVGKAVVSLLIESGSDHIRFPNFGEFWLGKGNALFFRPRGIFKINLESVYPPVKRGCEQMAKYRFKRKKDEKKND